MENRTTRQRRTSSNLVISRLCRTDKKHLEQDSRLSFVFRYMAKHLRLDIFLKMPDVVISCSVI